MTDDPEDESFRPEEARGTDAGDTVGEVQRKAHRMERARRHRASFAQQLAQVGALGWSFILPVLGSVFVGRWLEHRHGWRGATLIGLVLGLLVGGALAARRVRQALREDDDEGGSQ